MSLNIVRRCPRCGEPIPSTRLWGLSWSHDPWKCDGCGTMLRVDMDHRSNLTFVSTVIVCGLLAASFAITWKLAFLAVPGFLAVWSQDRAMVAEEANNP